MKKLALSCVAVIAMLSLSACGTTTHHKSHSQAASSSKVVKKHKKKTNKKKQAESSSNKQSQSQNSSSTSNSNGDQADPFNAGTWDKPYKGYPNFYAYMKDHPDTPNIQSQTAQMQHDENVKRGIENPDGSETQNFKNWVTARDWQEQHGNDNYPDYDANVNWDTWLNN